MDGERAHATGTSEPLVLRNPNRNPSCRLGSVVDRGANQNECSCGGGRSMLGEFDMW